MARNFDVDLKLLKPEEFTPALAPLIFEAAACEIEDGQWCRGTYGDTIGSGPVCGFGAIYRVCGSRPMGSRAQAIDRVVEPVLAAGRSGLISVNDDATDKRKVVRYLRSRAASARASLIVERSAAVTA